LPVGTSNIQFRIPTTGSQTYFIGTTYADPSGYSYFSAASTAIKFTYGSCNIPTVQSTGEPFTTFTQPNAKTYLVANIGAGNGSFGLSAGTMTGSATDNGLGGAGASWTYDGAATNIIMSGYTIQLVPGNNGGTVDPGTGAINGVRGDNQIGVGLAGNGGGSASFIIKNQANQTVIQILLGGGGGGKSSTRGGNFSGGGGGGIVGVGPVAAVNSYGGRGGFSSTNSTFWNGANGSLSITSTPNFGTVGNARPATSTCVIYFVVPNV
jgi:hypothetical protein